MRMESMAGVVLVLIVVSALAACQSPATPVVPSPTETIRPTETPEPTREATETPPPTEAGAPSPTPASPSGRITIRGVEVTADQVAIRGVSTLAEGSCVNAELWADGEPVVWWPTEACARVQGRDWELVVPVEPEQVLEPGVQYVVRAYQPGGPNIVATFPFDLGAPPTPAAPEEDPTLVLPESAEPLHRASVDLDGDGTLEEVALTGLGGGPDQLGYDFLQVFVVVPAPGGGYEVAWQSDQLPTDRGEPLRVEDANGDGRPEVLSVQAMGAGGEVLYVLAARGDGYGWLVPHGGEFAGEQAFGETGVRVEDQGGDGVMEILASYGPASRWTDVYRWDGDAYVYRETRE